MSALTLLQYSPSPWVIVATVGSTVLLWIGFQTLGLPGRLRRQFPERDAKTPEKRMGYTPRAVVSFARALGDNGLALYRRELRWDPLFAVLLGAFLLILMEGVFIPSESASGGWASWLLWLPIAYAACDVCEDLLLQAALRPSSLVVLRSTLSEKVSRVPAFTVWIASAFTVMKFLFVGVSGIVLVWGGVNLARLGPTS